MNVKFYLPGSNLCLTFAPKSQHIVKLEKCKFPVIYVVFEIIIVPCASTKSSTHSSPYARNLYFLRYGLNFPSARSVFRLTILAQT